MRLGFLYAGQGSQKVGMGKDLYENNPCFRENFDALKPHLREMAFEGHMEALSDTKNIQPIMVSFAIAVTECLKEKGIVPEIVAGLSLGEYSALYAANVFDRKTALELVSFRGIEMEKAALGVDSKMVAVMGLTRKQVLDAVNTAAEKTGEVVAAANFNCPGQIVVGGQMKGVDLLVSLAKDLGAKRCIELKVSGPFHTALMEPAGNALKEKFREVTFGNMEIPVVFNCTGRPLQEGDTIEQLLEQQVKSSVYFQDTIEYMRNLGIDTILEIGPGKALAGFVKKTSPEITVFSIEDITSMEEAIEAIIRQKGEA